MSPKAEKRKEWCFETNHRKLAHCNSCSHSFLLDDDYIVIRDTGVSRIDRKIFDCPVCGKSDVAYLEQIYLPSIRNLIAETIVHAFEDYIKDRNALDSHGKFVNRQFIKEAECWLFDNKSSKPFSLHWCCEVLNISKWKIRQICKKQRRKKDRGGINQGPKDDTE
jgi:hypothetical protein